MRENPCVTLNDPRVTLNDPCVTLNEVKGTISSMAPFAALRVTSARP